MPQLDAYSQRFANRLFAEFAQWRHFATVGGEGEEGYLLVQVPAPTVETGGELNSEMWMDTDGEVTVGFDWYHIHFASYGVISEKDEFDNAIQFIRDIIEERFVVGVVSKGEEWRGTLALEAAEEPDLSRFGDFDTVRIRSWKGTYSRIIKPPQNA